MYKTAAEKTYVLQADYPNQKFFSLVVIFIFK